VVVQVEVTRHVIGVKMVDQVVVEALVLLVDLVIHLLQILLKVIMENQELFQEATQVVAVVELEKLVELMEMVMVEMELQII
jgi:hypothetical protein